MTDKRLLGDRIRLYRKRAGLSQMDVELSLNASPGSLSRIESGEVNPTKETLYRIEEILNLNLREITFLINQFPSEVTNAELDDAYEEVKHILENEKSFAYLADERFRIWKVSKGFQKLWKLNDQEIEKAMGKSLLEHMFNIEMPVAKMLRTASFETIAKTMIARFQTEVPYWSIDSYSNKLITQLLEIEEFKKYWDFMKTEEFNKYIYNADSRKMKFKINGLNIETNYGREFLKRNPRFILVTYIPNKSMFSLIKSNIKFS